jgi:hypothetical protein
MVLRGLRQFVLRAMIFLIMAPALVMPSTAHAFDGDYKLSVNLNAARKDVTVTATRSGGLAPKTVTFTANGSGSQWTSPTIDRTNPDTCNLSRPDCTWTITVKDNTGKVLGSIPATFVNGNGVTDNVARTFTINGIPAPGAPATTGAIHGCATFDDYKAKPAKANVPVPPNVTIDIIQEGGTNKYTTNTTNGCNYSKQGIAPGTYTVYMHGGYQNPNDPSDAIQIDFKKTGVVVTAGGDVLADLAQKGIVDPGAGGSPSPAADNTPPPDCDAGGFTWIVCGVLKLALAAVDWVRDTIIVPFLEEKPLDQTSQEGQPIYKVWSAFRNLASVFFILIFFLLIFGQAIGFDNYTVKKVLPRLIAGAILVPFSWYICVLFIDIGNVLGQGILALTANVIPPAGIDFRSNISRIFLGGTIALVGIGVVGAIATISLAVIFSVLIALLGVFLTLVFRKIMITILIILSPFALLAWILPNTEKWWRQWWTNLFRLVMMYPLIMLLFEGGRFFAYAAGAQTGTANASVKGMIQVVALFAPAFLVPWTFKWAGGALSLGQGAIGKLTHQLDNRFGKDSDFAKDRAAERERLNLIREKNAASAGHNVRAAFFRARSGTGGGLTAGFGKGGFQATLRREEARSRAMEATATYRSQKQSASELPNESADQRIAAVTRQKLDNTARERAERTGILSAMNELGGNSAALTRAQYNAALINQRRNYAAQYGQNQGVVDAENAHRQGAAEVAMHGREVEAEKGAKIRGEVAGTVRTAAEIDAATVAAGGAANLAAARIMRLQGASQAAAKGAKDDFAEHHGKTMGINEVERDIQQRDLEAAERAKGGALTAAEREGVLAATSRRRTATAVNAAALGQRTASAETEEARNQRVHQERLEGETTGSIIENARLQARTKIAAEKKERIERVNANDPARGGHLVTDRMVLDAAGQEARDRATAEVGGVIGSLRAGTEARRMGENIGTQIDAAAETAELRRANEAGERRGILISRDADRRKVADEMGIRNAHDPRVTQQRISERLLVAAEHAEEKYSEESGARRATLDATHEAEATAHREGRDYHRDILEASGIKAAKTVNTRLGERQGVLDSEDQQNDHITDQNAARFTTERSESKQAGERRGVVRGTVDARQRLVDSGRAANFAAAASQIRESTGEAAEFTSQKSTNVDIEQAAATVRGVRAMEAKVREDARAAAIEAATIAKGSPLTASERKTVIAGVRPLTPDQARSAVMTTAATAAGIDASRKLVEGFAQERATVNDETANRINESTRINAAQYKAAKRYGQEAGDLIGADEAAAAEARHDNLEPSGTRAALASASRAARSATIDSSKRYSKAFGAEQATINVDRTDEGRITADQSAEEAENTSSVSYAKEAAKTKGTLTEQRKALAKAERDLNAAGTATSHLSAAERRSLSQKEVIKTAAAGANFAARSETGKAYEDDRGAAAGVTQGIANIREDARRAGETLTEAEAEERMYGTVAAQSERAGFNKVTGAVAEAQGISEARTQQRRAAMVDIAKRRGINDINDSKQLKAAGITFDDLDREAAALIDQAAHTSAVSKTRDNITRGTGAEIGQLRGEEAAIAEEQERLATEAGVDINAQAAALAAPELAAEARRLGRALRPDEHNAILNEARVRIQAPFRNQARQNFTSDNVRRGANDASLAASNAVGEARGSVETADAAVDSEMRTLQQPHTFSTPVTLANGTVIPADEEIPAGAVLAPSQAMPAHSTVTREQATERITRHATAAGKESGIRSQVSKQGEVAALAQAERGGTASIDNRITAATQDRLDTIAAETAKAEASGRMEAPGSPGFRTYNRRVSDATRTAENRLLDEQIAQLKRTQLPEFGGVALEDVDLSTGGGGNVPKLEKRFVEAIDNKNYALAAAVGDRLAGSNGGFAGLDRVRRYKLKGTPYDLVGPDVDPEVRAIYQQVWRKAAASSSNQDAKKPTVAVIQSVSPESLAKMGPQELSRNLDVLINGDRQLNDLIASETRRRDTQRAAALAATTAEAREAAQQEADLAQDNVTRYTGIKDSLIPKARGSFNATIRDTVKKAMEGDIRSWDNDAVWELYVATQDPDNDVSQPGGWVTTEARNAIEDYVNKNNNIRDGRRPLANEIARKSYMPSSYVP